MTISILMKKPPLGKFTQSSRKVDQLTNIADADIL